MKSKIFWAFDAFAEELKTDIFVAETLASLNETLKAEVHPVFMLGAEAIDSAPGFLSDTLGAMASYANKKIRAISHRVEVPGLQDPEVIAAESFSKTSIVKRFVDYVENHGGTLIVVGSHGRQGLQRAMLGSFAETLLLQSHLPVLVIGQDFDQIPKWDHILFPTDFSDDSSFAFNSTLELAGKLGARLTLFHHLSPLIDPVVQAAIAPFGGIWVPYQDEVKRQTEMKSQLLHSWAAKAERAGVKTNTFLDSEAEDTSKAILDYAKDKRIGLICMGNHSGAISTAIFGAISRKVVRQAHCPVWLLRRGSL